MKRENELVGHLLIILTMVIWGTTFVSTKILVKTLNPMEIAFIRFLIAYIVIAAISKRGEKTKSLKDEMIFGISGLLGITLYFLFENTGLVYTTASNAALIIAVAPLMTAILANFAVKGEKINRNSLAGFAIALSGIFLVVYNGRLLKLNPIGDLLIFLAALAWALYSVVVKNIGSSYSGLFINRKIFFYGMMTTLPFLLLEKGSGITMATFKNPIITLNLLFLGLFASAMCYFMWYKAVSIIGVIKTNNYIYLNPLVTLIFSMIILDEKITPMMIGGAVMILGGVYVSQRRGSVMVK